MGRKPEARRASPMWVNTEDLPRGDGQRFFERLNRILNGFGFGAFVEEKCAPSELARVDRFRKDKTASNRDWRSPEDPDGRIARTKDGRTHLAYKVGHEVDMDTGAIVGVTVHDACAGEPATPPATATKASLSCRFRWLSEVGSGRRARTEGPNSASGRRRSMAVWRLRALWPGKRLVMNLTRRPRGGVCGAVGWVVLLTAACGGDASTPTAPTPHMDSGHALGAAQGERVEVTNNGGVELKATAPVPMEPDAVEVEETNPVLVVKNAEGRFVQTTFRHEFVLSRADGSGEVARGMGARRDGTSSSFRVQEALDLGASYTWRARAVLDDAQGPWSDPEGAFSVTPIKHRAAPQLVGPLGGMEVGTQPTFTVSGWRVDGEIDRLVVQIRVAVRGTDVGDAAVFAEAEVEPGSVAQANVDSRSELTAGREYVWHARVVAYTASSREFVGPWSERAWFMTGGRRLGAPRLLAPVDETSVALRPVFRVRNGRTEGVSNVAIEVEVALNEAFTGSVRSAEATASIGGETSISLREALEPATRYFWRARMVGTAPTSGRVAGTWSGAETFETRDEIRLGPGRSHPPNLLHVVQQVGGAHPAALEAAYDDRSLEFLDLVVDALRSADGGRWGYQIWSRPGRPDRLSPDRLGYYRGSGSPHGSSDMATIDFIDRHNRTLSWYDATDHLAEEYPDATGRWTYPRPR